MEPKMKTLVLLVLLCATAFAGKAYGQDACQIDLAHYKMIEPGMTSAAVNQIIGCEGTEMSSGGFAGATSTMLTWDNRGNGKFAFLGAMFINDKLLSKSQMGLK
jgi:hypothetical protein